MKIPTNWHIKAIHDHLKKCNKDDIKLSSVNIPPKCRGLSYPFSKFYMKIPTKLLKTIILTPLLSAAFSSPILCAEKIQDDPEVVSINFDKLSVRIVENSLNNMEFHQIAEHSECDNNKKQKSSFEDFMEFLFIKELLVEGIIEVNKNIGGYSFYVCRDILHQFHTIKCKNDTLVRLMPNVPESDNKREIENIISHERQRSIFDATLQDYLAKSNKTMDELNISNCLKISEMINMNISKYYSYLKSKHSYLFINHALKEIYTKFYKYHELVYAVHNDISKHLMDKYMAICGVIKNQHLGYTPTEEVNVLLETFECEKSKDGFLKLIEKLHTELHTEIAESQNRRIEESRIHVENFCV